MRFLIVTAVLAVLVSACGSPSASGHRTQVSSNVHTATPTPRPTTALAAQGPILLDVKGSQADKTTRAFTASSTWKAHYSFKCMMVDPRYGRGVLQIYGINPKHPNGQEVIILYALTSAPNKNTTGTSDPVDAGSYKLRILADPVCSWHIQARRA